MGAHVPCPYCGSQVVVEQEPPFNGVDLPDLTGLCDVCGEYVSAPAERSTCIGGPGLIGHPGPPDDRSPEEIDRAIRLAFGIGDTR